MLAAIRGRLGAEFPAEIPREVPGQAAAVSDAVGSPTTVGAATPTLSPPDPSSTAALGRALLGDVPLASAPRARRHRGRPRCSFLQGEYGAAPRESVVRFEDRRGCQGASSHWDLGFHLSAAGWVEWGRRTCMFSDRTPSPCCGRAPCTRMGGLMRTLDGSLIRDLRRATAGRAVLFRRRG